MKIDIEIPEIMCDIVLKRHKYVTEKLLLYYDAYDGYTIDDTNYRPVECVVAYPEGRRPEILDEDYPLMEDCEDIIYDRVVKDLFNSWLINTLLIHDPN